MTRHAPFARLLTMLLVIVAIAGAPLLAHAQDKYPSRRITLVVPFGAGSVTDATARLLGEHFKNLLGQPVIVENRGGASGTLGAHAAARAAPDGYTLLLGGNTTHTAAPALLKHVPYDPIRDFTPIGRIGAFPSVMVTNQKQPFKTLEELVAHARTNPGKLTYGHGNSTGQITGETMKRHLGIDIARIAYSSNTQVVTDVLSNHIQLMIVDYVNGMPHIQSGALRALATLRQERSPALPEVPTLGEKVVPGYRIVPWVGLFGPAGMAPDMVKLLSDTLGKVLAMPEVAQRIGGMGTELWYQPAPEFARFIVEDQPIWAALVRNAGLEAQ